MAGIYNVKTGDTITEGLAGCTRSDEAIVAARRIAAERGEAVLLSDDDGEWLVHPDGRCDHRGPLASAIDGITSFDYLRGRVLKVDLAGDSFAYLYDRDNGTGAAAGASTVES